MNLDTFMNDLDNDYRIKIKGVDLFNVNITKDLSQIQKQVFAKYFYHLRGHFGDFLWYMGSIANCKEMKDIVIKNISEEFNGSSQSHEQMYYIFAEEMGVDLSKEFADRGEAYIFAEHFNNGHLNWLVNHDADECFAAFAAYERLDNIDYAFLLEFVNSMNVSKKASVFFKVHSVVTHFQPTRTILDQIWNDNPKKIEDGFQFIYNHQIEMWKKLWLKVSHS